ncbi:MAG: GNAT family N-acetyltransferase [Cyanobacteriota bacterium]|nr:GNAT family N-acetyltransferase [Cyanobacteriota bacterium]
MASLTARWHRSIREIPRQQWDNLLDEHVSPFYRWSWLAALEHSGSVAPDQGWQPLHLSVWREEQLVAFAPLYLKGHSYGEFVFDQSFARLAGDLGLRYYPKLIGMSPVSPIQGYRFHLHPQEDPQELTAVMLRLIDEFAARNEILSCNFLYVDPTWKPLAEAAGCAAWVNQQSLWTADGQTDFSDYLAGFNANQRRNIKRERKAVHKAGLSVTPITGEALTPALLSRMHGFYEQHCSRWGVWGSKYLQASFFDQLIEPALAHHVVLFSAHRGDPFDPVAMSLCVQDARHLWGRYWGSDEEIDCLHFEVCYYAPIEWALQQGLMSFDPGAGGSHKRRRGFVARPHTSLHRWYEPRMEALIRSWLPRANGLMQEEIEAINAELPFRSDPPALGL